MHYVELVNGKIVEVTDQSFQEFQDSLGSGPHFFSFTVSDETAILVNKSQIVTISENILA